MVIVGENSAVANWDSIITWDEAVSWPNLEPDPKLWEISQEDVRKFLREHKESFKDFVDKKTFEAVYKEVLWNEKIQNFIEKMVNREDIRQAVLEGDIKYIQQEVEEELKSSKRHEFVSWWFVWFDISMIVVAIFLWVSHRKKKIDDNEKKETLTDWSEINN